MKHEQELQALEEKVQKLHDGKKTVTTAKLENQNQTKCQSDEAYKDPLEKNKDFRRGIALQLKMINDTL